MKRIKNLMIGLLYLSVFVTFSGCFQDNDAKEEVIICPTDGNYIYFHEADFKDKDWENIEADKLYIIRSDEELSKYTKVDIDIDFSKQSLLLAKGYTSTGIVEGGCTREFLHKNDIYTLVVTIECDNTTAIGEWELATAVPILQITDEVKLKIN